MWRSLVEFLSPVVCSIAEFAKDKAGDILGAFLGFFFALLLGRIIENGVKKNSIDNLIVELKDIRDNISDCIDDRSLPPVLAHSISIPVWEMMKSTGNLLQFKSKPYYDCVISIYANIETLIALENCLHDNEHAFDDKAKELRIDKIIEKRRTVYNLLTTSSCLEKLMR